MKTKYAKRMLAITGAVMLLISKANYLTVQAEETEGIPETEVTQEEQGEQSVSNEEMIEDAAVLGVTANAESDFEWDGTIITGYKGTSQYVVIPAKATQIASGAFSWKDIVSLSFAGNKVSSIGSSAFYNCKSLKNVTLPNNLKKIESSAFKSCTALQKIVIPQSVHTIGGEVFYGCNSLNSVEIKGNVKDAGYNIFNGCLSLETVKLSENQTTIPSGMFYGANYITNIIIPNTVTEIGDNAFYNCNSLTNVTISSNAVKIGSAAFYNCNSLAGIKIPSSVKIIESYAFQNCASLKDVSIAEGVKTIGESAFSNCQILKEIVLPESLEEVSYGAFQNCISLEKVTVKSSDVILRSGIFSNDLVVKLYGLAGSTAEKYAKEHDIPFVSIGHAPGWFEGSDGELRKYDENGNMVKNQFAFDGAYTYYLQADGSPMKDRLTYHPDGKHIIYFDSEGHEVFNAFQYCPSVGYTCYFDSQGYLYKDQITFVGEKVYYLNANGKMEDSGWFRFANGVDFGYAKKDGTLRTNGFSYDPWGRVVFYHWNGMVARGLITDGQWYYLMDETDGHYVGSFPVN